MKNLQSRTKVRLLQSFLLISLSLFFLVNPAYAQGGFAVKGVIVDKTGFPLPGANVMEKGTSNGTITDLDGNFSLNVSKKGVTLTVSFMGYTPKDVVVKDKTMNITLEENSKLLDEVVVVGYGTMKKRDVTLLPSQARPLSKKWLLMFLKHCRVLLPVYRWCPVPDSPVNLLLSKFVVLPLSLPKV